MTTIENASASGKSLSLVDIERELARFPQVEMPLVHVFTPGLYVRQISIPAGTLLTSVRHLTEHPFFVLSGEIRVVSETEEITYKAPCIGVTKAGTKRALYAVSDVLWATVHTNPEDLTDPEEIGSRILEITDGLIHGDPESGQLWRNSPQTSIVSTSIEQKEESK